VYNIVIQQVYTLFYAHHKCNYVTTGNYYNTIDYIPYAVPLIPMTYSFHS